MNITLTGAAACTVAVFAAIGTGYLIAVALEHAEDWLTVTVRPLRIRRRWDHPGAPVLLADGREGAIDTVWREREAGDMALVILDADPPRWVPVSFLAPVPAEAPAVTA